MINILVHKIMLWGGLAGAGITLIIAIILYFKMSIKEVFADLAGIKLQKSGKRNKNIEPTQEKITSEIKLRKQDKHQQVAATIDSTELVDMGQLSGTYNAKSMANAMGNRYGMQSNGQVVAPANRNSIQNGGLVGNMNDTVRPGAMPIGQITMIPGGIDETMILGEEEESTTLLSDDVEETTLLSEDTDVIGFKKELDVVVVHTSTTI